MAAEALPRIFDPFFSGQLGRSGAGQGLSVVRMLVEELLHGQISVRSQVGLGTRVELNFDLGLKPIRADSEGENFCSERQTD